MANTEILRALQVVREAQDAIDAALRRRDLTDSEREQLEDLRMFLLDLDDTLVHADLSRSVAQLKRRAAKLRGLNDRTKRRLGRLAKVKKGVDQTAKVVEALIKATALLAKAGLL